MKKTARSFPVVQVARNLWQREILQPSLRKLNSFDQVNYNSIPHALTGAFKYKLSEASHRSERRRSLRQFLESLSQLMLKPVTKNVFD